MIGEIVKMSDKELYEEMKDSKSYDSRYFSLQSELEDRENN